MSVIQAIRETVAPIVNEAGLHLEEITFEGPSPKTLTIVIDSDSTLNLDDVTAVTKVISDALEILPALGDTPFILEVTSPGIDRPLTLPRHWRKNHGRLVTIALSDGSKVRGRIIDSSELAVTIDEQSYNFADIATATIEIEFKSLKKEDK